MMERGAPTVQTPSLPPRGTAPGQ